MTNKQLRASCLLFTVLVLIVPHATAQKSRLSNHDSLPPLMKLLDHDKNGALSQEEIAGASKVLKSLDTNGDGFVMINEVIRRPPKSNQRLSKYMMKKDKNGDGKLTKDELGDRFSKMFEQSDRNKDGQLTKNEILYAVDKLSAKPVGEIRGE